MKPRTPRAPKRPSASTTRGATAKVAAGRSGPRKAAAAKSAATTEGVRKSVDEMVVQADLAAMDARDQWNRLMTEMDRRRAAFELAMRRLASGGAEATRTMNEAVREAMTELRDAVDNAVAAFRT